MDPYISLAISSASWASSWEGSSGTWITEFPSIFGEGDGSINQAFQSLINVETLLSDFF
jgi:hypothetical protein